MEAWKTCKKAVATFNNICLYYLDGKLVLAVYYYFLSKGLPRFIQWASFVAQLVKNTLAMQETWVRSLVWEDPLEKGKATH